MAHDHDRRGDPIRPVRRIIVGLMIAALVSSFLVWRIDGVRMERVRTAIVDAVVPRLEWAIVPVTGLAQMADGFRSYARLYEQNQQLRRELQQMKAWKEAALQLEQKNARLLDLNNVKLDAELSYITGSVLADAGSPFRRSVLLNVGARDGIRDGWAAMDGLGLVGRISGVGRSTARVILLTDPASSIPVTIQPSGQKVLLSGDIGALPLVTFLDAPDQVRPGDRVVTSGDGGVFPAGLLVGAVARSPDNRFRVRLAADYGRLEFLRVLRHEGTERIGDSGGLIGPPPPPAGSIAARRAPDENG